MNAGLDRSLLPGATRTKSIVGLLGKSEKVQNLLVASANDLSAVNEDMKLALHGSAALIAVEKSHEKIKIIEDAVKEASETLAVVNQALAHEIRDRHLLEHQFAAATEQKEAALFAAFHDVLSGLPNRALFMDRLAHGLAQAKRHGWTLAVMFIDLDKFKSINDTYGHEAGDIVLQTTAQRLKEKTRGDDTVSRHGGDEFLHLVAEIEGEMNIAGIAGKLLKAIQAPCDVSIDGVDVRLNIGGSIGISMFPKDGIAADALLQSADRAMYQAKQDKSGYAFAT